MADSDSDPREPAVGASRRQDRQRNEVVGRIRQIITGLRIPSDVLEHLTAAPHDTEQNRANHDLIRQITCDEPLSSSVETREIVGVAKALERKTGLNVFDEDQTYGLKRLAIVASQLVGLGLLLTCSYLALGGLLTTNNAISGNNHTFSLLFFVALLVVLGVYESLHIAVTQLRLADLRALEEKYPRTASLHTKFDTSDKIERFLAGRQIVVILTVFFAAQLTSTRLRFFPGTDTAMPALLQSFAHHGIPGALFVLWTAQLMPQFIATRRSLRIMNRPIIGLAFNFALLLEALGIARPGSWFAAWDNTSESIPTSREMLWDQSAFVTEGFGLIGKTYDVGLSAVNGQIAVTSYYLIGIDGLETIVCREILPLGVAVRHLTTSHFTYAVPAGLLRGAELSSPTPSTPAQLGTADDPMALVGSDVVTTEIDDRRTFAFDLRPKLGSFSSATIVSTTTTFTVEGEITELPVVIDQSMRFLTISIEFTDAENLDHVSVVDVHRRQTRAEHVEEISEPLRRAEPAIHDGRVYAGFTVDFPDVNSVYLTRWTTA
jgi:hypothetical protein